MALSNGEVLEVLRRAGEGIDAVLTALPKDVSLAVGLTERGVPLAPRAEFANGKRDSQILSPQMYFTFKVYDLTSDYGFDRGNLLEKFLSSWADARGWPHNELVRGRYLDSGFFLWVVWQKLLSREEGVEADFISKIHHHNSRYVNPVRVDLKLSRAEEARSFVFLTSELVKLADETFGGVSQEWLGVFLGSKPWYPLNEGDRYDALGGVTPREMLCRVATALEPVVKNLDVNALELLYSLTAIDLTGGAVSRSLNFGLEELNVLTLGEAAELIVGALAI